MDKNKSLSWIESWRFTLSLVVGAFVSFVIYQTKLVLLLSFFSLLIAVVLSFPLQMLKKRKVPHLLANVIVLLTLALLIFVALKSVVPLVSEQAESLVDSLPSALDNLKSQIEQNFHIKVLRISSIQEKFASLSIPVALGVFEGLTTVILVLALGIFFAVSPGDYKDTLRSLTAPNKEMVFIETWNRMACGLRAWMGGILISMTIMGLLVAIGLRVIGIDSWLALAALTFFGTFVPYAGAIASSIPALIISLAQSPSMFLKTFLVYIAVHIIEGYVVQPLIMKQAVEIKPGWLLMWQAFMGATFGAIGIIVATPMLVCVQIAGSYLYFERILGRIHRAPNLKE